MIVSYNLQLEVFEGPFDLLIHLIDKQEINIYDIPIAVITEQYIDYIREMKEANMEIMSEFIVMAAHLLEIKSKMLLPKSSKEEKEEELDPRQELVDKLIEYKKIKQITEYFKDRQIEGEKLLFKIPEPVERFLQSTDLEEEDVLTGLDLKGLFNAFQKVVERNESRIDKIRSGFKKVHRDLFTIEQKIEEIESILRQLQSVSFISLFDKEAVRIEIVVTFLALLELIKMKKVKVSQDGIFDEIWITYLEGDGYAAEANTSSN